jgi:hypothetical protein
VYGELAAGSTASAVMRTAAGDSRSAFTDRTSRRGPAVFHTAVRRGMSLSSR